MQMLILLLTAAFCCGRPDVIRAQQPAKLSSLEEAVAGMLNIVYSANATRQELGHHIAQPYVLLGDWSVHRASPLDVQSSEDSIFYNFTGSIREADFETSVEAYTVRVRVEAPQVWVSGRVQLRGGCQVRTRRFQLLQPYGLRVLRVQRVQRELRLSSSRASLEEADVLQRLQVLYDTPDARRAVADTLNKHGDEEDEDWTQECPESFLRYLDSL